MLEVRRIVSTPPGDPFERGLKFAGGLLGIVGASAGLIYATGGLVIGLRLLDNHFAWEAVVGQLPRQLLLSSGLSEVMLPALAVGGLYSLWRLLAGPIRKPKVWKRSFREQAGANEKRKSIALASALSVVLVAPAAVFSALRHFDLSHRFPVLIVGFLVVALATTGLLELRSHLGRRAEGGRLRPFEAAALMALVITIWTIPGFILLWANVPLPLALLCATHGRAYHGRLIGETSDRTFIGEPAIPRKNQGYRFIARREGEAHHQIVVIPFTEVRQLVIGHRANQLICTYPRKGIGLPHHKEPTGNTG
jgi:hypothetical protein